MIKNIIIPERIGSYYLFTKRILGIDIGKTSIKATLLKLQGDTISVQACIEEKIETGTPPTFVKRTTTALKQLFSRVPAYDQVYTCIPTSLAVFKELTLPFISPQKIKMVIGFEVEPLLPFARQDAIIDFIITKQHPSGTSVDILIAAIQKQHIAEHLALFESVQVKPTKVTLDIFELYGLLSYLPQPPDLLQVTVYLEISSTSTRIIYCYGNQLKFIRSLANGYLAIAQQVAHDINKNASAVVDHIFQFGLNNAEFPDFTHSLKKHFDAFLQIIQFTLTSFSAQTAQAPISQIVLIGDAALIKGLNNIVSAQLAIECSYFNTNALIDSGVIQLKNIKFIPENAIFSLATALPNSITQNFNLCQQEFDTSDHTITLKNVCLSFILSIVLISALIGHHILQVRALKKEIKNSTTQAVTVLKEQFPSLEDDDLETTIDEAKKLLNKERETWNKFSPASRILFLRCLLELFLHIDRQTLGFIAEQITLTDAVLTLKAKVKNHTALGQLEESLHKIKLFTDIEPQENPEFTMKIILAKPTEEY